MAACPTCGLRYTDPPPFPPAPPLPAHGRWDPPSRLRLALKHGLIRLLGTRAALLLRLLTPPDPRARLVDVGCGDGRYVRAAGWLGWTSLGVDLVPAQAKRARGLSRRPVLVADAQALPLAGAGVHVLTLWHVLEHVPAPREALAEARRALAPGGYLLLEVPNAASVQARWMGNRWLHWDFARHFWHFTPPTLTRLLRRAGFRQVRCYTWPNTAGWQRSLGLSPRWTPFLFLLDAVWAGLGKGGVLRAEARR